jgi:Carbamoyl-phosphate synthase L chain, ATP binding domain
MRFDYPSKLPQNIQDRALDVATRFLKAIGYSHGLFNMEFFYDAETDKLTVIEFNPRMASQFADLYLRVDGVDLYAMALELAHGRDPSLLPHTAPTAQIATSAVYRVFDSMQTHLQQTIPSMPTEVQLAALKTQFPDHTLLRFPKTSGSTARDFKWLGSYRYGILHLGGQSEVDLTERLTKASEILGWPAPLAETYPTATFHTQPTQTHSTLETTEFSNQRLTA